MASPKLEYSAILIFKVAPMLMAILLAVQIMPQTDFTIPLSFSNQLFVYILSIIIALAFIEGIVRFQEEKGKGYTVQGFSFAVIVAFIVAFAGVFFAGYIIYTDYQYNNSDFNMWLGIYYLIGALMIFVFSKEDIFIHQVLVKAART